MYEREYVRQIEELRKRIVLLEEENSRLEKLSRQADASNKAKSDFLAMISHEIRTPMNGVIGLTELLLDTKLDEKQEQYAGLILISARNLLTLINSILDFSKIEADKMELEIAEFNLGRLVDELIVMYGVSGRKKKIRIYAEVDESAEGNYRGDSYRIRQILINLLGNGIKFTEAGSVVLRVKRVDQAPGRERIRFEVCDSGPGIPADKLDQLFKPFSQLDISSTRRYGGTGLGLSISQKLVKLMGGQIGVESEPDRGSTFWFTIPLDPVDSAISAVGSRQSEEETGVIAGTESMQSGPEEKGPMILIVEDDETNRFVLEAILRRTGARSQIAYNGREAVDLFRQQNFDLIFMDCQMPVMDGFEATEKIHSWAAQQSRKRPHVIALTADATKATRQRCKEVGMDDYLVKPLDFVKLQRVLDNWLPEFEMEVVSPRHAVETDSEPSPAGEIPPGEQIDFTVLERLNKNMGNVDPVIRVFLDFSLSGLSSFMKRLIGKIMKAYGARPIL